MNLLILDYDNTLADVYGEYWEGYIFRNKTREDIQEGTEIYEKYRRGPDTIVMFNALLEAYDIPDAYRFFEQHGMGKQLFPDTVPWLEDLRKYTDALKVVILTTGDEKLQEIKIDLTGLRDLVDEVVITRNRDKTWEIKKLIEKYNPEKTIFLDDRIHMTEADFDTPIQIIEMDRNREKSGDSIVHSLWEISLTSLLS